MVEARPAPVCLESAGFFVLRTPLLAAYVHTGQPPEVALVDPFVREAVGQASPSLLKAATEPGRDPEAARPAIERYLERMRARATPFSLMGGYSHGPVGGDTTELRLCARERATRI